MSPLQRVTFLTRRHKRFFATGAPFPLFFYPFVHEFSYILPSFESGSKIVTPSARPCDLAANGLYTKHGHTLSFLLATEPTEKNEILRGFPQSSLRSLWQKSDETNPQFMTAFSIFSN